LGTTAASEKLICKVARTIIAYEIPTLEVALVPATSRNIFLVAAGLADF
jgi:hypothetical protein